MNVTPKIGLSGSYHFVGNATVRAALIVKVETDGTVDLVTSNSTGMGGSASNVPFVDIGGTLPASGGYFQAIDPTT